MSSHDLHTLIDLTTFLSAYQEAARAEEDAAAALHTASIQLEQQITRGDEPPRALPFTHPSLVSARAALFRATRAEADAYRDWEEAFNRYLRRAPGHRVEVHLHNGRFIPVEFFKAGWMQLRSLDMPDTNFPTQQQAVLWLHHQLTEKQLEISA